MRRFTTLIVGSTCFLAAQTLDATVMSPAAPRAIAEAGVSQFQTRDVLRPTGGDPAVRQILTRIRADAAALRQSGQSGAFGGQRNGSSQPFDIYMVDSIVEAADHLSAHPVRRQVLQVDL